MGSLDFLQNNLVEELKEKGFEIEDIQEMTFGDIVNALDHPKYKLEVDNQYGESVLYSSGEIVSNEDAYMYTLPNGTLIITDPKVTKYVERSIKQLATQHGIPGKVFRPKIFKGPWENDEECVEYERDILKKRGKYV